MLSFSSLSPASAHKLHALSDACTQRLGAEALCEAWRQGGDSDAIAAALKKTVAYESSSALGKACVYQALYQLGRAHHDAHPTHQSKRWWRGLDAQFADGKRAWKHVESSLQQAEQVPSLRASLSASREQWRASQQEVTTLRATIDSLLVHVRGEAALQRQLQALLCSLTSAQLQNQALQSEVCRLQARVTTGQPAGAASLEALLRCPQAGAKEPVRRGSVPSMEGLFGSLGPLDSPPSYPQTPQNEAACAQASSVSFLPGA